MHRKPKRFYGTGHLHFITCSCYQRRPFLEMPGTKRGKNPPKRHGIVSSPRSEIPLISCIGTLFVAVFSVA
jgi:hypothetical protein